ncbi:MAG: class I SAM-dependent methyltransferase [Breznakibacter sp.]
MASEQNYIEINKRSWNERTEWHFKSDFYDVDGFLKGNTSLKPIELELLGNLKGKRLLHLQCHFGQDTISLARLGAHATGIDLSDKAIAKAKELAGKTNSEATFICCDIYDLPNHLSGAFDVVFTSYGVIGWLPDLDRWAKIVSGFLKTNGKFVFVEFHPVVWMFDDDFSKIAYNYFNAGAIKETEDGTYADKNAGIKTNTITWNHSMGEVFQSLVANGLEVVSLKEYDYSPYDCFQKTIAKEPDKFIIGPLDGKIPMVYSIVAVKK